MGECDGKWVLRRIGSNCRLGYIDVAFVISTRYQQANDRTSNGTTSWIRKQNMVIIDEKKQSHQVSYI